MILYVDVLFVSYSKIFVVECDVIVYVESSATFCQIIITIFIVATHPLLIIIVKYY